MLKRLLGLFLHVANSSPPLVGHQEFYALKTSLLKRYGVLVANDWQHIVKECWNCADTGTMGCYRCRTYGMGGGTWDEFYVWLERWKLGNYEFHTPRERVRAAWPGMSDPDKIRVIEGYIRHQRYPYYLSAECWYWLLLFFDTKHFLDFFGHCGHTSRKFTPMVIVGTLLFNLEMLRTRQANHFKHRESDTDMLPRHRRWRSLWSDDEVPF